MTVPAPGSLTYAYSEDGVTTVFAYPLRFLEASELVVIREVGTVRTTLVLNTDYTVAGAGSPSGGSITRDVATDGGRIIITRSTAWKQTVDLQDNGRNPADAVEQQLDRLAMAGQDTRHQLEAKADTNDLADVALSGDYGDLSNTPTLGSMASEDAGDYTKTSGLAAVAVSGDYDDLANKPTLGTMAAEDAGDYTKTDDLGDLASKDKVTVSDIDATGTASASTFLRGDGSWAPGGGGGGDVFGPDSAVDGVIALFDGATGKLLKAGSAPFSGSYDDLTDKPTLGTMAAEDASDYTKTSGLAAVAVSGDYGDLADKPTLGTMAAETASDYAKVADLGNAAGLDVGTTAGTVAAGDDSRFSGNAQLAVEDQSLTGGARVTSKDLGTISSGTVTPDPGDRPLQHYTNGGAHTLAPGSNTGSYLLDITNNGSAGAITTSGWTKVSGDAFTTTNGHKFRCHCSVGSAGSYLVVGALQ